MVVADDAVDKGAGTLYHALVDEFLEGFFLARHTIVVEELVPEAGVDKVTGGMLGTAHIEVHILPVFIGLTAHECLVVVRVHVAQVVGGGACESRHGVEFDGEYGGIVDERFVHHGLAHGIPGPTGGSSKGRLARLGGFVLVDFGQFERQFVGRYHIGHAVFVVYGERFSPVALAGEDGVAQAVVHLHTSQVVFGHILLGGFDGLFHGESVEREVHIGCGVLSGRVAHDALFGVEALLAHVAAFDEWYDGQVEMLGECIVARVVGRNGHDGAGAVAREHIVAHPDGNGLAGERVDGLGAGEDTRHAAVGYTVALGAFLGGCYVVVDSLLLLRGGHFLHILALRGQYHEGDTEHGVGTCGEDGEVDVAVFHVKHHLGTFRASYPVALCLFQRVGPLYGVESVEQALCIGRHTEAPLLHLLLHHGESAAHAQSVDHLVVGQHGAQAGTPVHHGLAQVGYAVVHEHLLLFLLLPAVPFVGGEAEFLGLCHIEALGTFLGEMLHEGADGKCLPSYVAIVGVEHLLEGPLCPFIVAGVAGAHLAVPVEAEAYLVELFAVTVDIVHRGDGGVLSGLYGILLGGQSISVVSHGVEHIESLLALVAGIDIGGDIAQGVSYMESGSRRIGEHIEHIEFLLVLVLFHLIGLLFNPSFLPFFLYFPEIVFH